MSCNILVKKNKMGNLKNPQIMECCMGILPVFRKFSGMTNHLSKRFSVKCDQASLPVSSPPRSQSLYAEPLVGSSHAFVRSHKLASTPEGLT